MTLATGRSSPSSIAVSSAGIFWIEGTTVNKVGLTGAAITTLASGSSVVSQTNPGCLAADASNVYWTNYTNPAVMTVPASGNGTASVLVGPPLGLSNFQGVALVSGTLYYVDNGNEEVDKVVVASGAQTRLENSISAPINVAADSNYVYFTNSGNNLFKVAVGGGTPVQI